MLDAFLQGLAERGVSLRVEGDRLIYRGPPGSMLDCDRDMLREHKAELIERLTLELTDFEPIDEDELPAWIDNPALTVSVATVRESIEYHRASLEFEARAPRQPGRERRLDELARAEANLDAMQATTPQADPEPHSQPLSIPETIDHDAAK